MSAQLNLGFLTKQTIKLAEKVFKVINMEYQNIRFSHDSHSQINKLIIQREFYSNQKPYTKAIHSDPYIVKRFNEPESFTGHDGCVNTVVWNDTGRIILSGSGSY